MKTLTITIITLLFLIPVETVFAQNFLIVFTTVKDGKGCGDMSYQKIEVKNWDDYYKQSETLRKQYGNRGKYEDKFVSAQDYAVLVEYTGQHYKGSCTFRKYALYKGKSLEKAREFGASQYKNYSGLFAGAPTEISVFSPDLVKTENAKTERDLGDVNAVFFVSDKGGKPVVTAQFKNKHTTKSIVVKVLTLDAGKNVISQKTEVLKKGTTLTKTYGEAGYYEVWVSDAYEEEETEAAGFIDSIKKWIYEWLIKKEDIQMEAASSGIRG